MALLATKPPTASAELRELLEVFSQGDLAVAMGKPAETISRMKKSSSMRRSTERLIDDFWYASHIAYQCFGEPETVRFFVLSRQPELDGKTPAELIAAGEVDKVVDVFRNNMYQAVETEMPAANSTTARSDGANRLAAIRSRQPTRLRDRLGVRQPIRTISEERSARYELQDEAPPPRTTGGRTTGITYPKPAF